jgi:hypothetical protein
VQGKCKVYPGIDIGIPTGKHSRTASPDDTLEEPAERGTRQAFDEFMQGVPDVEPAEFDQLTNDLKTGK